MHLITLVNKSDEILTLKLRTLLKVVDFFLKYSEFSKGKRDKNSKSISYTYLAVSRFPLTSVLSPVLTGGMS